MTLNTDGSFTYTPDADFFGTDTFTYTATNSAGSDTATVTITVNQVSPPATPPTAVDDAYATDQDAAVTTTAATGVLANDTGTRPLSAGSASNPPNGTVTLNADGSFTYTPDPGFFGTDTFTYTATNSAGSDSATVTITVNQTLPPVTAPTAVDDAYATDQDSALSATAATGVLANDTGTRPLTAGSASTPAHGTVSLNATGSFTYTPDPGFFGTDTFTYTAINSAGSDSATVTITVSQAPPVVTAPTAIDDSYATPANTPLSAPAATGVLANDTGTRPLTAGSVSSPAHGSVSLNADGSFTYTPASGFSGADTFTYTATNGAGSDTATVTITVMAPPNRPPVARDDTFTTPQDTPLTITTADLLANDSDPDGDLLKFATPLPLSNPKHGTATQISATNALYTPDPGFSGTDSFTYAVSDGSDSSAPATVTITVKAAVAPEPGGGGQIIINPDGGGVVPLPGVIPVIRTCQVRVDTTVGSRRVVHRVVLASGRTRTNARRAVNVKIKANKAGLRRLRDATGGVPVALRVICRTRQGEVFGHAERGILLLRVRRVTTPPGSWVGDRAVLTATGQRFMRKLKRGMRPLNVITLRCDGYTALAPGIHPAPIPLSRRRAIVACSMLRQSSLRRAPRIVARGASDPLASNANEAGRRVNRRVTVTFVSARSRSSRSRLLRAVSEARAPQPERTTVTAPDHQPNATSTTGGVCNGQAGSGPSSSESTTPAGCASSVGATVTSQKRRVTGPGVWWSCPSRPV